MQTRAKFLFTIIAAALAAVALAACASGGSSSAASSASASGSSSASTSASSSSDDTVVVLDGNLFVEILLDYNAGTGYEWTYTAEPEGVLSEIDRTTEGDDGGEPVDGAPLTEAFVFITNQPGEVVLTFNLVRPGEEDAEPAETQVYAFTVDNEMSAVLNPYKSDFDRAPLISSGS